MAFLFDSERLAQLRRPGEKKKLSFVILELGGGRGKKQTNNLKSVIDTCHLFLLTCRKINTSRRFGIV